MVGNMNNGSMGGPPSTIATNVFCSDQTIHLTRWSPDYRRQLSTSMEAASTIPSYAAVWTSNGSAGYAARTTTRLAAVKHARRRAEESVVLSTSVIWIRFQVFSRQASQSQMASHALCSEGCCNEVSEHAAHDSHFGANDVVQVSWPVNRPTPHLPETTTTTVNTNMPRFCLFTYSSTHLPRLYAGFALP